MDDKFRPHLSFRALASDRHGFLDDSLDDWTCFFHFFRQKGEVGHECEVILVVPLDSCKLEV